MSSSPSPRQFAALLVSAVLGGAVAVGAAVLIGGVDGDTTVVTQTVARPSSTFAPSGAGMSVNEIYERAAPGVVRVNATNNSTSTDPDPLTDPFQGVPESARLGSGFVIDKAGHIVTNYHVVRDADNITVSFSNRDTVKAEVVGTDPVDGPRSPPRRVVGERAHTSRIGRLGLGPRRRLRRRDRESVRPRPDRHLGHRERASAADHGAQPLHHRSRHPDGRADQPGQLGWPAPEHARAGDRCEHPDRDGHGDSDLGQRRDRVRGPREHREGRRGPDPAHRPRRPRLPRHHGPAHHRRRGRAVQPSRPAAVSSSSPSRRARAPARRDSKEARPRSSSPARPTSSAATSSSPSTARQISSIEELRDVIASHAPGDKVTLVIYRDAKKSSVTVTLGRQPASPQG